MIRPVPCACGNDRPLIQQVPAGVVIACDKCGRYVLGGSFADAERKWGESVERWNDAMSEMAERLVD